MTHILKINKEFFESLNNEENTKILKIYGYNSPDSLLKSVIERLNFEYNFLFYNSQCF